MINVVLLGAGNVGTHLYRALNKSNDIALLQWYNRSANAMKEAKGKVELTTEIDTIKEADLYLLAVSDSSIALLSNELGKRKGLVAHTAGSIPMHVLDKHLNHGVFYPLQTFSKQKEVDFHKIPLCLEANTAQNLLLLEQVAKAPGGPVYTIDSTQRKALHIAAVFVNNFVNHLYSVGEQICEEHQVPFSVLHPLILETADKIKSLSPEAAQTGPALRGDQLVLNEHLKQLTKTTHKELYSIISAAIQHHG